MAEQPSRQRGDEAKTDLPPRKEPTYEGPFGDEEQSERSAGEDADGGAPRGDGGGEGEGGL